MTDVLRIILVSALAGWFSWFLGKTVFEGIRTGAIRHTDSTKVCKRQKNPIGFWALVSLFAGLVLMFVIVWGFMVIDAVKKLK